MTDVLDVYEMTPLQAGMLFHSLYAPADTSYFEQYWCTLEGPLDIARFKAAWQAVIARHAVLRSECQWDGFDAPVQVVYDDVNPEWTFADWSGLSDAEEEAAFESWRVGDRQRGFRMDEAPLLRFALLRLGPQRCRFVWSFHHLLMDGWCGALLVREVFLHYGGNTLPAPPPPYRNYVDWRASQDMAAAEHYWRSCLDGIGVPAPIGIARVSTGERGVAELRETLPAGLYLGLKDMARRERLTVNTLLQGAWSLLLSRYGGRDDVAFGAVLSGRPPDLSGVEQMIGLFLNTVPIRVDTNPQQPLIPWLQALQAEQRQRETFGYAALPDIQRWAGLEGGQALFDSLLIVETYPQSIADVVAVEDGAITVRDLKNYERTHYPVTLKILPGSQMELALVFDTAHITETAAQRLLRHFATVLQAFVRHPFAQLGEIEIVDEAEIQELIALGKGPTAPLADPVHVQFLAQAQARPDAMAIEYIGESGHRDMRYRDLDMASADIAAALQAQGVAKGDVVALCLDRGPDLIAALLGILRAGAVYLPVDPDYPAERLAYVIGDSGTALALVDRRGREALGDIPGLVMVNLGDCMAGKPGAVLKSVPVGQDDLAYILYTSGSTGRPKGVPIRHGSLANFLQSMAREPGLCAKDRLLALTTISFDIAALELFGPLVVGATVVIGDASLARDGYRIAATLDARDISVLQATPAGWRLLIESCWSGQASLKMLCGGEALDGVLARELARRGGALWNLYGPTETAIWSAAIKVGGELLTGGAIPVGGPIDRTSFLVLDARGRPVPRGIAGELHIGGAGLSPGYHRRPDLTKAAFVECTVPGEEGVLYRTGDQVRYRDDGLLEFLGRLDGQVKLRGFRIELGEIEARLSDHPLVAEAVAMVRDDGTGPRLVAYLRSNAATATVDGLRQHLAATLPAYMIPGAFVFLDRFPLTPNGKVDRRALPMPGLNSAPAEGAATLTRELVGNIWADVLGTETVEADANFFALGGHSLLATRVIGQVKRATGVELNLRDLFEAPVLSAFCQRIDAARGLPQRSEIVPADKALAPCLSFAQQRQWVMAQIDPGSSAYLMPSAVRLSGELDLAVMEEALSDIVARHEILRTSFPAFEGEPVLRVAPVTAVSLPFEDLSVLSEPERQTVLTAARRQEATLGFDLDLHSPWRTRVLRLSQDEHVLLFTLHHILADEWSLDILLKDLAASYAALRDGRDTPTVAALAYTDFAAWQRSLSFDREREYWCQQLAGAPVVTPLPADFRRPEQRNGGAASQPVRLSMETVSGLRRLGLETGSTLFMCLLAAFKVLIYRHTDYGDILVGTPVANRQQPEVQGLVGLFANTVVIRSDLSDNPPFDLLLERLRDTVLAAHAHQDMPFEQVLDAVNVPRSDSHAPLVQCFFSLETLPRETEIGGGLHLQALPPVLTASARFDLSLVLNEGADGLSGNLIYAVDMFTPETARALCERFQILLDGLVAAADRRLSELPLLRDEERGELDRWARGDKLPDTPRTVHGSFCAWALSTPDAIAIQSPLGQLTYRQLYRRVMSMSAQLRDHGINRGDAVGVSMEGEVGTVASILGVLSLGAVCVPLDAEMSGQNLVDLPVGSILAGVLSAQPLPSASSLPWISTAETAAVIDGGAADPPVSVGLDEAAFILAGAGAALPAGLAISHLNVHALSRLIDVASGDVLEHGGVACSSADILALMAPMMTGGALLLTSGKRGWPEDIVSSEQARRSSAVWLDHATLATLESGMGRHLSGATRIVTSAALGAANTDLLRAAAPETEILLVSGPAEAPATLVRRLGALNKEAKSVVGQPAPGSLAYVLDGNGQIVPPGVPGVLYIGGAGVAVGYLGQAAVTAERFSPNPFIHPRDCAPGHEVLHRTFQRARWRHDGVLEWLGETDHRQAISVSRLAPRPHALTRSQTELTGTTPDGDLERMLAQVWCETLGLATVGRSDNFFDLGGDSILAMRLVHRASRLGLVIEPRDIFRHQTIAGLANVAKWSERTDDVEVKAFALVATDAVDLDAVAASVSFGDL